MTQHDRTVLLVDDDDLFLDIAAQAVEMMGYNVMRAVSGADALKRLEDGAVDLLLTDANLTEVMDGFTLAQEVRAQRPDLPILYISGDSSLSRRPPDAPEGAFLAKPASLQDLAAALRTAFDAKDG